MFPQAPVGYDSHTINFDVVFLSFSSKYFLSSLVISSLAHRFRSFTEFPNICVFFLNILISTLILLWSKNIFCIISILPNLLSLDLQPSIWSISEGKSYFVVVGQRSILIFVYQLLRRVLKSLWLSLSLLSILLVLKL